MAHILNIERRERMYRNLLAEMVRRNITGKAVCEVAGFSSRTWLNKSKGITQFTLNEAIAIREQFFPDLDLEYLFMYSEAEAV